MIIGGILAHNEEQRIQRPLKQLLEICETVIVLDDCSKDNTVSVCKDLGATVISKHEGDDFKNGREYALRNQLYWSCASHCRTDDWIIIIDADQYFMNEEHKNLPFLTYKAQLAGADNLNIRLYDMWNDTEYREDEFWNAHLMFYPIASRYNAEKQYQIPSEPIHCGSLPVETNTVKYMTDIRLIHTGWVMSDEKKKIKSEEYKKKDGGKILKDEHYNSICDKEPNLKTLKKGKILISAPVFVDNDWKLEAFKRYLKSLRELDLPDDYEVRRMFCLHNSPDLVDLIDFKEMEQYVAFEDDCEYNCEGETHEWKQKNLQALVQMKNFVVEYAKANGYDYIFWVDADLVLQKQTLTNLLSKEKDIIAECFWTKWKDADEDANPNCWSYDHYTIIKEELEAWKTSGVYEVGGTGACILIKTEVYNRNVHYGNIPRLSMWGEDRHFCVRAICNGRRVWLCTENPPKHLYRKSEL